MAKNNYGYKLPGPYAKPKRAKLVKKSDTPIVFPGTKPTGRARPTSLVTDSATPTQRQRKAARGALKNAGITRAYLAKTTGTTKVEGGGVMSAQIKAFMKSSKIGAQSTQVTRAALSGGKTAGVPRQGAKARKMVRNARQQYRGARRTSRSW